MRPRAIADGDGSELFQPLLQGPLASQIRIFQEDKKIVAWANFVRAVKIDFRNPFDVYVPPLLEGKGSKLGLEWQLS